MKRYEDILGAGFKAIGLSLSIQPFLHYLDLLDKWNKAYNLTAVRAKEEMIIRHILDSLAVLPFISKNTLLDVGTGPGLPGIPLALAKPELQCTLLDSNGKKTRFLQEAKRVLKLQNIDVINHRVEDFKPQVCFDIIISRAFSNVSTMIKLTKHLLAEDGEWIAMKGRIPTEELTTIEYPYKIKEYAVPGTQGERCCIIIHKTL
jgi:16S rRNA (guanine527-N7)-methyltransferase